MPTLNEIRDILIEKERVKKLLTEGLTLISLPSSIDKRMFYFDEDFCIKKSRFAEYFTTKSIVTGERIRKVCYVYYNSPDLVEFYFVHKQDAVLFKMIYGGL
jgi:hypothetical protein